MTEVRIRPLEPAHLPAWLALQSQFPDGWSAPALRSELEVSGAIALGGWQRDRLVGAIAARRVFDELSVLQVVVDASARQRGVGRRLVEALLGQAVAEGAQSAWLEVRRSNSAAITLYERCGFRAIGRRPGFYPDGEDATLMSRSRLRPGLPRDSEGA